ncbi:unnamed protein product [Rhizoctonia solani]|uniref:Uncharacterized protein n=1 Tax=Rhizoctonia solani TaxID=456999 RepID=A0A8H3GZE3_9AGAM|nr:unnamed protein product [Rhizoctonia solani]
MQCPHVLSAPIGRARSEA